MILYCDMDRVLVDQQGMQGFDKFPWMKGGRHLWEIIRPHRPVLLTQVRTTRFAQMTTEKLVWVRRELGPTVPMIATPETVGKGPFGRPGALLIDDSEVHTSNFVAGGGDAVLWNHRDLAVCLDRVRAALMARL